MKNNTKINNISSSIETVYTFDPLRGAEGHSFFGQNKNDLDLYRHIDYKSLKD